MAPLLTAQEAVPSELVNDLITDLKQQGYGYRLQKGYEFLTGIEKKNGPPCESKEALLSQTGRTYNNVISPQPNTYWVSLNRRRELLLVRGDGTSYSVYGQARILEQVDPFTYKVEEMFCECTNCVERDGYQIRIFYCELDANKKTCSSSSGKNCRIVRNVRYYCGRLIYSK
ncbi:MAG: hypothetical protein HRU40_14185 [Saprospiraceae bacterium]|nr:hypothetical protein [Saprospiraceae bacterium]